MSGFPISVPGTASGIFIEDRVRPSTLSRNSAVGAGVASKPGRFPRLRSPALKRCEQNETEPHALNVMFFRVRP